MYCKKMICTVDNIESISVRRGKKLFKFEYHAF